MKNKSKCTEKKNNKEKGITLIALIITIIVLLILAGVALATLTGDSGILSNAEKAKEQTNYTNSKEQVQLAVTGALTDAYAEGRGTISRKDLKDELDNVVGTENEDYTLSEGEAPWEVVVTRTEYTTKVYSNGKTQTEQEAENEALQKNGMKVLTAEEIEDLETLNIEDVVNNPNVKAVLTDGVVIPTGFTYVEGTKDTGVVISAKANGVTSEFVWVPVPDISEMAKLQEGSTTNYEGIFKDTLRQKEPRAAEGDPDGLEQEMQNEYNDMVASVIKYKGFYIGRYETSRNGTTVASTKGTTTTRPMTGDSPWAGVWHEMYNLQKDYSIVNKLTAVKSSMIWGSQYDALLRWAGQGDDASKITTSYFKSGISQPGTNNEDKINNIYDLRGNVLEWILGAIDGASNYWVRMLVGGRKWLCEWISLG